LLDWFNSLKTLGIKYKLKIEIEIEIDFEAVLSASSVVNKITEIKQADHELVNEYFDRCIKTMMEFKSKIDPNRFVNPSGIYSSTISNIRNSA
jgi:hypothetical protein